MKSFGFSINFVTFNNHAVFIFYAYMENFDFIIFLYIYIYLFWLDNVNFLLHLVSFFVIIGTWLSQRLSIKA